MARNSTEVHEDESQEEVDDRREQVFYVGQSRSMKGGLSWRIRDHNALVYRASIQDEYLYQLLTDDETFHKIDFIVLYKMKRTEPFDPMLLNVAEAAFIVLFRVFKPSAWSRNYQELGSYGIASCCRYRCQRLISIRRQEQTSGDGGG